MNKIKVTAIIPTYNRACSICESIDSVLSQSYKCFQVLVIDDGSTDNTRELVSKYGKHVEYIYKKNGGVADARNEALKYTKGDYVAYLDSDDLWLPDKIKIYLDYVNKYIGRNIFIFSDHFRVDAAGMCKKHSDNYSSINEYAVNSIISDKLSRFSLILDYYTFYPSTFFLPTACHQYLKWRLFPRINEDFFFVLEAAMFLDFIYINIPLTVYNVSTTSISSSIDSSWLWSIYGLQVIEEFYLAYEFKKEEKLLFNNKRSRLCTSLAISHYKSKNICNSIRYCCKSLAIFETYKRIFKKLLYF